MTETPVSSVAPGPSTSACAFLCLLALLLGLAGWLFTSAVVSFADHAGSPGVEYVLVARPFSALAVWCLGALGLVGVWQAVCGRRLFRLSRWQDAFTWPAVAPLTPMLLLALPAVALALVASPLASVAPPWLYLFIDLRWWLLTGILTLLTIAAIDRPGRPGNATRSGVLSGSPVWELLVITVLLGCSLAFSPKNRFDPAVVGDEPKYMRYLESWYRGGGADIEDLVPIQQLPIDYQPRLLDNFRHLGHALAMVAADLSADARRLLGLPAPARPGPATSTGDAFVEGKRGGIYQVHNPGLSLLLFPGYFIDRFALTWASHSFAQGPSQLYATNVVLLSLYLFWGVGLFWLLASHTNDSSVASVVACVVLLSLPATAFSYQYYPEVAAGLLLVLVGRYVTLSTDAGVWPAFGYGVLAGFLPWLHVRFGYVSIVAAALVAAGRARSAPRSVVAFLIGTGLSLGTLCLYSYHITGSLLPFKVWNLMMAAEPTLQAVHPATVRRLVGLWLDFNWGLLPHAPVYLLALAGVWPMWQRSRRMTAFVALTVLPLVVQAAAYNWHGSGTAPLRIVTAVVPLLAIPLADAVARFRRSRWFLVTFAMLAAVSVDNGLSFNSSFDRARPVLVGPTMSGWLSRLAFPHVDTPGWLSNPLVIFWGAITLSALAWPIYRSGHDARMRGWSWTRVAATVLIGTAAISSAIGAWTGVPHNARFVRDYADARDTALRSHLGHGAGWIWSAQRGSTTIDAVFPNPAGLEITVSHPSAAVVHEEVAVTVAAAGGDGGTAWGTLAVDFGDGRRPEPLALVGAATARRAYARPGDYLVTVTATMPGDEEVRREARLTVTPANMVGPYGRERIQGLPPDVMDLRVTAAIDSITIDESRVELHCSSAPGLRGSAVDYWVWLVGYEQGIVRARLHVPRAGSVSDDPRHFTLSFDAGHILQPGGAATIIVGIVPKQSRAATSRSPAFSFPWPAPELTIGSPIVVTATEAH